METKHWIVYKNSHSQAWWIWPSKYMSPIIKYDPDTNTAYEDLKSKIIMFNTKAFMSHIIPEIDEIVNDIYPEVFKNGYLLFECAIYDYPTKNRYISRARVNGIDLEKDEAKKLNIVSNVDF